MPATADSVDNENLLFGSNEFLDLSKGLEYAHFLEKDESNITLAKVSFSLEKNLALSIPLCPYAGIYTSGKWNTNSCYPFIRKMLTTLKNRGVQKVVIKQAPTCVNPNNKPIHQALLSNGFEVSKKEINHHLDLTNINPWANIHLMERRKINRCSNESILLIEESPEQLREVYDFIVNCRKQQSLKINISFEKLLKTIQTLPGHYRIFSARSETNNVLAATITVQVTRKAVYNYLPAFDRSYKSLSPLAFLTFELIKKFQSEGLHYWDLGISSIESKPQEGLIAFKERMGGIRSERLEYTWFKP